MKILPIRNIKNTARILLTTGALIAVPLGAVPQIQNKQELVADVFENTNIVTPKGTTSASVLFHAPSPYITVKGEEKIATIVVDLNKNILYKYDSLGIPQKAYLIASGKSKTPTDTGIRVVSHVERYPYKSAPQTTKRYKNPSDYGPRTIILLKIDPITGEKTPTGEFIHGNNNSSSIGKYVSKGCMRMDNEVIKELASQVKRGDIVVIDKF